MKTGLWISLAIVAIVALVFIALTVGWAVWGRQLWRAGSFVAAGGCGDPQDGTQAWHDGAWLWPRDDARRYRAGCLGSSAGGVAPRPGCARQQGPWPVCAGWLWRGGAGWGHGGRSPAR